MLFGLSACGDSSSSPDDNGGYVSNDPIPDYSSDSKQSDDPKETSSASGEKDSSTSSSSTQNQTQQPTVSSSSKTATQSSEEELNPPSADKVVNGTCSPKTPSINKGEIATWEFYRESGDVFDVIITTVSDGAHAGGTTGLMNTPRSKAIAVTANVFSISRM